MGPHFSRREGLNFSQSVASRGKEMARKILMLDSASLGPLRPRAWELSLELSAHKQKRESPKAVCLVGGLGRGNTVW